MPTPATQAAVGRLASRALGRTEADVQADIYSILTSGELSLDVDQVVRLEQQVGDGTRRRLDVEVGRAVIEVKKDLRPAGLRGEAEQQLTGYVTAQSDRLGTRYVGILTDGTDWYLYHLVHDQLSQVAHLSLQEQAPDADRLLIWLESILATQDQLTPTPDEISRRLGAESPAHLLDHATLAALYEAAGSSTHVALKRGLWSKLLRTAFGTAFRDNEQLFLDHTLLVLTAEIIAHAVVGFDISPTGQFTPQALTSGTEFANAQIHNVVEADFFDWVVEVPGGAAFVTELARRIARFDWSHVEHDVLKILYESVIDARDRAALGEYYTPDWLAEQMVATAVPDPLNTRVLDPACGSGTFLFHAVRAYLAAADNSGVPDGQAVSDLSAHVYGMDVHPVAVTLARVTYLLAIGQSRLVAGDRGPVAVPVYLATPCSGSNTVTCCATTTRSPSPRPATTSSRAAAHCSATTSSSPGASSTTRASSTGSSPRWPTKPGSPRASPAPRSSRPPCANSGCMTTTSTGSPRRSTPCVACTLPAATTSGATTSAT